MALDITFQKVSKEDYTYSDLHLDLDKTKTPLGLSNSTRKSGSNDFKTNYDENAIANSLRNLFSTSPKQRILNPEYGLNFSQFLFERADEYTARLIARTLINGIERYEPRVTVRYVNVNVDEENNIYNISLSVFLPTLNRDVNYDAIFDRNGFTI